MPPVTYRMHDQQICTWIVNSISSPVITGPYLGFYFNRGKNRPSPSLLPHSFPFTSPSSPFPHSLSPLTVPPFPGGPAPKGSGERCMLSQRIRAVPGHQMVSDAF